MTNKAKNLIMNMKITILSVIFSFCVTVTLSAKEYNIIDFGAKSDTTFLSTRAIQAAIDECSRNNGGKVVIPSGTYLSGTICFKSNVTLSLEKGATLFGSPRLADYPVNLPDYTFFRKGIVKRALIYAENCSDIAIEGEGTIDGQGGSFRENNHSKDDSYSVRPYLIWMIKCKNVRTEGVRLRNSALWMQHYLACDQLYIHNIDVFNHCNKNNDMIDIDGCHEVRISDCVGDSDDDGITLKSTSGRGNENIVITNCLLSSHCNALKMGTESNSGFKNVSVSNIVIRPSKVADRSIEGNPGGHTGIALEEVDGGVLDGVVISNITIDGAACPIFIRLGNRARPFDEGHKIDHVGSLQNISISNVVATGAKGVGCSITGIPGYPVKGVRLSHIRIEFEGGGKSEDVIRKVSEKENSYPEHDMFGVLPSYGFYVRHAENIHFNDVQLATKNEDLRPAIFLSDVSDAVIDQLHSGSNSKNTADIYLETSRLIRIGGCFIAGKSNSLVYFAGGANADISLYNNEMSNIKSLYTPGEIRVPGLKESGNR